MIYLIITLAMGLLVPIQTAANSRLRMAVGQAYVTTLISFSVSSLALLLVAMVAGIAVVLVVVLPRLRGQQTAGCAKGARLFFWQLCAIVSGCLMASIGAIYALLGSVIGSAIQASTVSFLISTSAMLLFCLLRGSVGQVRLAFRRDCPWWMWLGGICGAITVYGNAWLIPKIGVGLFVMLLLIGQLLLSLLMEQFGWLGAPRKRITALQVIGLLLMLGGVALIRL